MKYFRVERPDFSPLVALTIGAGFLRAWGLWRPEFQLDEAQRLLWALDRELSLGEAAIGHVGAAGHVLLLRALWAVWDNPAWMRFPAFLAGIITVPLFFAFVRSFSTRKVAFLASGLLAFSPMHVAFSQQCEEYVFGVLFVLLGTAAMLELLEEEKPAFRAAMLLGLFETLGLFLGGYWSLPYWAAFGAVAVFRRREKNFLPLLFLSQLPLLGLFAWLGSYWLPGRGISEDYVSSIIGDLIISKLRFAPGAQLVDLVALVEVWIWIKPAPVLLLFLENFLAGVLLVAAARGWRGFSRRGLTVSTLGPVA
ncbi:MAG: glycosyltransferase family 39 protein, partial [Bdellovibrionota bacterium]